MDEGCLLCSAQRVTEWHLEDDDCWVADCLVCMTPMIVWRTHGLPDGPQHPARERHPLLQAAAEGVVAVVGGR